MARALLQPVTNDVDPNAEPHELRFRFDTGRPCLDLVITVGERWRRSFERLRSPDEREGSAAALALTGIRENPTRMPAIGAPSRSHIRTIYTISAIVAGIAGTVLAQTTSTVSLGVLDFQRSAEVVIILVLGGAGRLYGGLVGAIIFMVARDQFSGIAPQYWYFWIGALLVTVVMLLPNGILGGLAVLTASWRGKAP